MWKLSRWGLDPGITSYSGVSKVFSLPGIIWSLDGIFSVNTHFTEKRQVSPGISYCPLN